MNTYRSCHVSFTIFISKVIIVKLAASVDLFVRKFVEKNSPINLLTACFI